MRKVIFWLPTIFCIWEALVTGLPLRISPDEFQHLEEEEILSRAQTPRTVKEDADSTTEMSVEENVRRMQGNRNRAKQNRLAMVKNQIETLLNIRGKDMPSVEEEFGSGEISHNISAQDSIDQVIQNMNDAVTNDQMGQKNIHHHHGSKYSDYTEKLQSLYPECNLTNDTLSTNEVVTEIMGKGHVMHIRFALDNRIHSPEAQDQYVTEVLSGRLRLFQNEFLGPVKYINSQQLAHGEHIPNQNIVNVDGLEVGEDISSIETFQDTNETNLTQDSQMLRIIVSWVKENSTVVLDSKNIPKQTSAGGRWISFDILKAVKAWSTNTTENFGIIIEIEHMSSSLPADSVFREMNCSDSARHPFPSVLENLSREIIDDLQIQEESSDIYSESLNTNMYPMLDVSTVEIPKSEVSKRPSSEFPLIPIINLGNLNDFNQSVGILVNSSSNQYILSRIHNLRNSKEMQAQNEDMEFKIPSDLASIGHHQGIRQFRKIDLDLSKLKSKNKLDGFQTLPKLENIKYSPLGNSNNGFPPQHRRRHTTASHSGKHSRRGNRRTNQNHHSKSRNQRHKRRNHRHHNRRHDPLTLRDIANDQPTSSGSSNDFSPYAPIIEQVKLTNEELKQIIKLQEKNIAQELKLLQQFSQPTESHHSQPQTEQN